MPQGGREAESQPAQPGYVEARLAVSRRLHAEVELRIATERVLRQPGHLAGHLRLGRRRTSEVGVPPGSDG